MPDTTTQQGASAEAIRHHYDLDVAVRQFEQEQTVLYRFTLWRA